MRWLFWRRGGVNSAVRGFSQGGMAPAEHSLGDIPAQTGVGDGDAVTKFSRIVWKRLTAFVEVTFDHQAGQRASACDTLLDDAAPDIFLPGVLLGRVGVTAIHHQHRRKAR